MSVFCYEVDDRRPRGLLNCGSERSYIDIRNRHLCGLCVTLLTESRMVHIVPSLIGSHVNNGLCRNGKVPCPDFLGVTVRETWVRWPVVTVRTGKDQVALSNKR
jgi:hypothetical protein